jgi:F-type H+-transporting ATPase subunit b
VNDVKARLEGVAQSLGQRGARLARDVGRAAAALLPPQAAKGAPDSGHSTPAGGTNKQKRTSPLLWPLAGAASILALGLAIGVQSLDDSKATLLQLNERIGALSARVESLERSNTASLAESRSTVAALDNRVAAAENLAGSSLAQAKKAIAAQAAMRVLAPGETVIELPDLEPIQRRIGLLEEKLSPHAALAESGESHAAEGAHAPGVFPPFDAANFAPVLIWLALSFGLLYLLMAKVALPRVEGILHARAHKISEDIKEAHAFRARSEQAAIAHDKTISDAKAKAQALAQETRTKLNAETDAKRHVLEADLNAKLAASESQIMDMKAKAMANVDEIAREAAAAIVQHVTGKPADASAVAAAVAANKA